MKYGFCTGFATEPLWEIRCDMLERIRASGFDYAELPIMTFADMGEEEFSSIFPSFSSPVACNLFPGRIPLVSKERDFSVIRSYLDTAFCRCRALGIKETVFGSGKARSYNPDEMGWDEAYGRLKETIAEAIIPKAVEYGITVLIEPLKRGECNLINTVSEGYALSEEIGHPSLLLMADIYHMESNGEDVRSLVPALDRIRHIHIAGKGRCLDDTAEDAYIYDALRLLKRCGYDRTVSFETSDGDISSALSWLKRTL